MDAENSYVIIEGEAPGQDRVRPHNWAERFASNFANYGPDRRLHYSDEVTPLMLNGTKCLRIIRSLEITNPTLFWDMLAFAKLHALKVTGLVTSNEDLPLAS